MIETVPPIFLQCLTKQVTSLNIFGAVIMPPALNITCHTDVYFPVGFVPMHIYAIVIIHSITSVISGTDKVPVIRSGRLLSGKSPVKT